MSHGGLVASRGHGVRFYRHDSELVGSVVPWVLDGVRGGRHVLVLLTDEHLTAVARSLEGHGVVPGRDYVACPADTVIARVRGPHGRVAREPFYATVDALLGPERSAARRAGREVPGVLVVGEPSSVLRRQGAARECLDLEALCGEAAAAVPLDLRCVYALPDFDPADLDQLRRTCRQHTHVEAPEGRPDLGVHEIGFAGGVGGVGDDTRTPGETGAGGERTEVFLPVPQAVAGVRRLVSATLDGSPHRHAAADAALLASELATNAFVHSGGAPFRVTVAAGRRHLRIAIEDGSDDEVRLAPPTSDGESGRGVAIIDALASRWGASPLAGGKVVWAEIDLV